MIQVHVITKGVCLGQYFISIHCESTGTSILFIMRVLYQCSFGEYQVLWVFTAIVLQVFIVRVLCQCSLWQYSVSVHCENTSTVFTVTVLDSFGNTSW